MVDCLLMVQWVVGSIPQGGPIELRLVPASAPQLVYFLETVAHVVTAAGSLLSFPYFLPVIFGSSGM